MADKNKNRRFVAKNDATYVRPVIPDTRSNNYDPRKRRFYEKHESHEIFYDPYQGRVVRRGIPLEMSSPEFDILGIGRAMSMIRRPTIALTKRRDYNSRLSPRNYEYKKALEEGARHEAKTYAVESGIDNSNIDDILLGKINSRQDVVNEHKRLMSFFGSDNVANRIRNIDFKLGTSYRENIDLWDRLSANRINITQNLNSHGKIHTPIDKNGIDIFSDPRTRIELKSGSPITTYGHEARHMLDRMDKTSKFIKSEDRQMNNRLKALFSDENGNSLIVKDPNITQWYKNY